MPTLVQKKFPELAELEELLKSLARHARIDVTAEIEHQKLKLPQYTLTFGSSDPKAPVLALFGGVHGLERIGSGVLIAYLHTLSELLEWDQVIHRYLRHSRLIFMPIVNPMGMYLGIRSNANGVDLMRNAPVEAEGLSKLFLMGGHRLTNRLPWYRGLEGGPMELEARTLCELVRKEIASARVAVTLDVHSGYGAVDRLWFPYAKTKRPFPNVAEVLALKELLDRTYPNHVYKVEPQSKEYTAHGDLWDYLYDEYRNQPEPQVFLPLSLEMGSWRWIKKDPTQLFSALGAFNPLKPHRHQRTLRRHLHLFEFLHRAVLSFRSWAVLPPEARASNTQKAMKLWYEKTK